MWAAQTFDTALSNFFEKSARIMPSLLIAAILLAVTVPSCDRKLPQL